MNAVKEEDLETLRVWIKNQPHLPWLPDEQLILFLHSCYYNSEHAKQAIDVCFTIRTQTPEIFGCRNPTTSDVLAALDVVEICTFPKRDKKGQIILFMRLKDIDVAKFNMDNVLKAVMLCFEILIRVNSLVPGYVIMTDVTGFSFSHITRINIRVIKKLSIYVQEGFPLRMKAVHFFNVSPVLDKLMMLIKPFLSEELTSIFFFHNGARESLHKEYDRTFMPSDYGGKEKSVAELCAEMKEMIKNSKDYIEEEAKWRVDESKRVHKLKIRKNLSSSFKKLSID